MVGQLRDMEPESSSEEEEEFEEEEVIQKNKTANKPAAKGR